MLFMEHRYLLECSQCVTAGLCLDVNHSTPFPDTEFLKDLF